MLVNLQEIIGMAEAGNYCIPAFNVYNIETVMGVIKAAEEAKVKADAVAEETPHESEINIDAFAAVELRTAKILACERVPKAKKLLKLQIDLGYEQRQIVSGIAKFYEPEQLIGKKVAVVANLAPVTLCGVESRGMLLASGEENVRVIFLADDTPLGERIH